MRAVVLGAQGKFFCAGMDLTVFGEMQTLAAADPCDARKREGVMSTIQFFQDVISGPENIRVPVIAAVGGGCIGAGVDMITACDLVYVPGTPT